MPVAEDFDDVIVFAADPQRSWPELRFHCSAHKSKVRWPKAANLETTLLSRPELAAMLSKTGVASGASVPSSSNRLRAPTAANLMD